MKPRLRTLIGKLLVTIFILNCFSDFSPALLTARAQRKKVIVVNAEQPNLWTLEQAHYLLAQMHRRNLDLKAKSLEELDPNEIAGLRFDVMRMLVEFGATFNQAELASNRLLSENQSFNAERRQGLLTERDGLRRESVRLAGEIEELETEKANTGDEDAKKVLDARIAAKNARLARVDKEIENLNGELGTLNAPSGTPTATTGGATFEPEKLPKSSFDDAFKEAAKKQIEKFNESPQLNASLRLDNFLQMQYEIISKQLALLRDELGPGERLVFLELPQTVNATHHESERKWAQSWWKIVGYTYRAPVGGEPTLAPAPTPAVDLNQKPIKVTQDLNSILHQQNIPVPVTLPCESRTPAPIPDTEVIWVKDVPTTTEREPSVITVRGVGKVAKVTVTLNGLRHPRLGRLDLMLVGPQKQNALIMSDVGGDHPADGVNITLDDDATDLLTTTAAPASERSYRPKNFDDGSPDSPAGPPQPLGGDLLSIFKGTNPNGDWKLYAMDDSGQPAGSIGGGWSLTITPECPARRRRAEYKDRFVNLDKVTQSATILWDEYLSEEKPPAKLHDRSSEAHLLTKLQNRAVRTVELIPRQGSLNVNDMKLDVKAGAFNFVLSTLFGFGSRLNVQRQREQFSQFVQQELYSAAFGKGAREFGWTFTQMPGTDRIMSGVRTTYAVVVVPDNATSVVLESNGCYFPRSYYPPNDFADTKSDRWNDDGRTSRNCGGNPTKAFVVPIPSARLEGGNEFWVEKVNFQPVGKGKQAVVAISGENFSPQMGVLVNGVPLLPSLGLAQPHIIDDSAAGRRATDALRGSDITGHIERVDTEKIIFSLKMAPDFVGTPVITLVAPGRATDINDLPLEIRGMPNTKLADYRPTMFGFSRPADFRVDGVKVFRGRQANRMIAQISGAGFVAPLRVLVNGSGDDITYIAESSELLTVDFPATEDETIKVTLVSSKGETAESDTITNPAFRLSVTEAEVETYEAEEEGAPATILVKIKGTGFRDSLTATLADKVFPVAVKSATEAVFTMPDPKGAAIVTLRDDSGQRAKVVVVRKTKKP